MKKILVMLGTRPDAIKMAPVVDCLKRRDSFFDVKVCVTAQHREMIDQVIRFFSIQPDYDLNVMKINQTLFRSTSRILLRMKGVLEKERPDMVLVQGDTTTSFVSSLAAFYLNISIGHIEAGLRTQDKYQPFPEEINRRLTTHIADIHFAPTQIARKNLITEGIQESKIYVTGNTVVDALLMANKKIQDDSSIQNRLTSLFDYLRDDYKLILVTAHRRENFGQGIENICLALKDIIEKHSNVEIVYPVHLNPNVQEPVYRILGVTQNGEKTTDSSGRIHLIKPLSYESFIYLLNKSYLVMSDSGGLQEETPTLKKPLLLMRNCTERPEAIEAGTALLVGTDRDFILSEVSQLLSDKKKYNSMLTDRNPFGDGKAAEKIADSLLSYFNFK
ncbi:MAG: UDP-N-acetylglucosamine 2-epimerase (non-hydrolyzing) [Candidatus Aureabacteria bacterium]|nr:UDP-N-acetylglucosamine 2-epimerase (non-hydrolyzing) [Candidatus Auribacterota bacterium]